MLKPALLLILAVAAVSHLPYGTEAQAMPFFAAPMLRKTANGGDGSQQAINQIPFNNLLAASKMKDHLRQLHERIKNGARFDFSKMGPLGAALNKINDTIHGIILSIRDHVEKQGQQDDFDRDVSMAKPGHHHEQVPGQANRAAQPRAENDTTVSPLSLACATNVVLSLSELVNFNPWAMEMFDAFGKLNDGIMWGNVEAAGSFDECVQVRAFEQLWSDERPVFQGQYCTVMLNTAVLAPARAATDDEDAGQTNDHRHHRQRLRRRLRPHHDPDSFSLPPFSLAAADANNNKDGAGVANEAPAEKLKSFETLIEAGIRGMFPGYHGPVRKDGGDSHLERVGGVDFDLFGYYGNIMPFTPPGFGACVPSTCSEEDTRTILAIVIHALFSAAPSLLPPGLASSLEARLASSGAVASVEPAYPVEERETAAPTAAPPTTAPSLTYEDVAGFLLVLDCQVEGEKMTWDETDIVVTSVLAGLAIIVLSGTLLDWRIRSNKKPKTEQGGDSTGGKQPGKWQGIDKDSGIQVLLSFSALSNGEKLLNTTRGKGVIGCLDGIRFLSMTWVVLGHCFLFAASAMWVNSGRAYQAISHDLASMAISNATMSVDSFFFLSGFLVAYILLRQLDRNGGKFNLILYYLHRYLRLTPALAAIIMLQVSVFRRMGDGPLWYSIEDVAADCRKNWWKNILYIGNFDGYDVSFSSACIGQAWYLFCDMQLYLFSPLFILPLHYFKGKVGEFCLGLAVLLFWISPMIVTAVNNFSATIIFSMASFSDPNMTFFFQRSYSQMYVRGGPYVIGIALGYIMFKTKGKKVNMSKWMVILGWTCATLGALAILYGPKRYFELDTELAPSEAESVAWSMFRNVWALCLAWVVFACANGYGGFVDTLLSWEAFAPLSRLTYSTYLVSVPIQFMYQASRRTPLWLDYIQIVYWYLAILFLSMMVAFVFSLFFEMPFLGLEKVIFKPLENLSFGGRSKPNNAAGNSSTEVQQDAEKSKGMNGDMLAAEDTKGDLELKTIGIDNPGFQADAAPAKH